LLNHLSTGALIVVIVGVPTVVALVVVRVVDGMFPNLRDLEMDDVVRDVVGVWTSDAFGPTIFRAVDGEIRGVLRMARGTVIARLVDGVLVGTWCEAPTRRLPRDLGEVQWRMTKSAGTGELIGRWGFGNKGAFRGGWDLIRVGGKELEPPDVISLFDQPSRFCRDPTRRRPARTTAPAPLGANVRP
jgi:hypothetical protein